MRGSRRSLVGLDGLNFFVANVQTGFGPFIAVYLTTKAWTQGEIGEALSLGAAAAMLSQLPCGALVDRLVDKRRGAAVAGLGVAISAVLFAAAPVRSLVMLAEVLHSVASSMLNPCIAAITLGLVSADDLGERLGRNARFASLGCGAAAAVMGACGTYVSNRAVFWLTAALMVPALWSLRLIGTNDVLAGTGRIKRASVRDSLALLLDRDVLAFSACAVLFHLSSAAMLPLAATDITRVAGSNASLLVAACIILPQGVVALLSPWVGRLADRRGHRLVMIIGFAALPLRGVLLALVENRPELQVAVQLLDGVSGTVFGIMLPLVAADLMRGTGRFNLCMGVFGLACTLGGTLSTLVAGYVADALSQEAAFLILAALGVLATLGTLVPRLDARRHAVAEIAAVQAAGVEPG